MSKTDETRRLFGTDGIRGVANQYPMTARSRWPRARGGRTVPQGGRRCRVVIGKDTRLSGYMIESALEAGIVSAGADVMLVGPLPHASHRVHHFQHAGRRRRGDQCFAQSLSRQRHQNLRLRRFSSCPTTSRRTSNGAWPTQKRPRPAPSPRLARPSASTMRKGATYSFSSTVFPRRAPSTGARGGRLCHGAAYTVAPQVFSELGADVTVLSAEPNGRNINDGCGALHPEKVAAEVRRTRSAIGVALDGDADRVILADERGEIVDGDPIMAILGTRLLARGALPGNTVVATAMSNLGLGAGAGRAGGQAAARRGRRSLRRRSHAREGVSSLAANSRDTSSFSKKRPRVTVCWPPCRSCRSWSRKSARCPSWPRS